MPVVAVRVTLHPVVGANVKTAVLLTDRAVGVAPWCSLAAGLRDGRTASVLLFYLFLPYFLLIYFLTLQYVAGGASSGASKWSRPCRGCLQEKRRWCQPPLPGR